jgi:hypothetical protein
MDKTDNKTETKLDKSNRNKERLPFTDSAIQKWFPSIFERGEPMVCTIEDAYRCFMGTDLDMSVCENFILYKEQQNIQLIQDYKNQFILRD